MNNKHTNSHLNGERMTAQAFSHALQLIQTNYPDMPKDRQIVQAKRLAAKINKREKH